MSFLFLMITLAILFFFIKHMYAYEGLLKAQEDIYRLRLEAKEIEFKLNLVAKTLKDMESTR